MVLTFSLPAHAQDKTVIAECALLEKAYKMTQTAGHTALPDILAGCPKYGAFQTTMTRRQDSKAIRKAMTVKKPAIVKKYGRMGKILFQRMISRGVPVDVAQAATATNEYRNAVAAYQ